MLSANQKPVKGKGGPQKKEDKEVEPDTSTSCAESSESAHPRRRREKNPRKEAQRKKGEALGKRGGATLPEHGPAHEGTERKVSLELRNGSVRKE